MRCASVQITRVLQLEWAEQLRGADEGARRPALRRPQRTARRRIPEGFPPGRSLVRSSAPERQAPRIRGLRFQTSRPGSQTRDPADERPSAGVLHPRA